MSGREVRTLEEAARCCAALSVSPASGKKGAQGTITFIEQGGRCLGITNQHVIGPQVGGEFYVSLRGKVPLPGRLVMTSARDNPDLPLDIALFSLHRDVIMKGGKAPYPLRGEPVSEGSSLLAVGYPGETEACFVTGGCIGASDRRIILHDRSTGEMGKLSLGGMSGGPIFALREGGLYELVGVIYQGRSSEGEIWIYGFPVNEGLIERAIERAPGP